MPSPFTRRLLRLPIRALAVLLATVAAAAAVWYSGLSVLNWLGVANPARGDTGTALGLGAATIGSSIVPTWLTARYYFESNDRLRRSSAREPADDDAAATIDDDSTDTVDAVPDTDEAVGGDHEDTTVDVVVVDAADTEPSARDSTETDGERTAVGPDVGGKTVALRSVADLPDTNTVRNVLGRWNR